MSILLAEKLLGIWITDPEEISLGAKKEMMHFMADGRITYTVIGQGKMFLTYRVEEDILITDQPSEPREERTKFHITPDDKLLLDYQGKIGKFVRGYLSAPHNLFQG